MKAIGLRTALCALLALNIPSVYAKHANLHIRAPEQYHKHHRDAHISKREERIGLDSRNAGLEQRHGKCEFPTDAGLVPVTPNDKNGGWAMSPDQCCEPGGYCPYACPSGQVMAQWDPDATSYTYPQSMVRLVLRSERFKLIFAERGPLLRSQRNNSQTIPRQTILRRWHGKYRVQEQGQRQRCLLSNGSPGQRGHVDSNQHRRLCDACSSRSRLLGWDRRTVRFTAGDGWDHG